jgi:nitrogen fixation NifU-like protein
MNDIADLYQELIVDHSTRPRNFKALDFAQTAEGYNPLCGDRVKVYLRLRENVIIDASFEGDGCAISKASASLMTEAVKGRRREEIDELFARFHDLVTGSGQPDVERLKKLAAFSGLRDFPARVKCGMLAWYALRAALQQDRGIVSTE